MNKKEKKILLPPKLTKGKIATTTPSVIAQRKKVFKFHHIRVLRRRKKYLINYNPEKPKNKVKKMKPMTSLTIGAFGVLAQCFSRPWPRFSMRREPFRGAMMETGKLRSCFLFCAFYFIVTKEKEPA